MSVGWGNRRGTGASHVKDLGLVLGAGGGWLSEEPHGYHCILKDSLWLTWVEGRREAGADSGEPQCRWERPDEGGRGKARRDRFPPPPLLCLYCSSSHSYGPLATRRKQSSSPLTLAPETTSGSVTEPSAGQTGVSS